MIEVAGAFVGGVLGSAHCVGMCGGFAAAIGTSKIRLRSMLARQLVYSLGRVFTYAFLGALGGSAGLYLAGFSTPLLRAQQVFSILAGVIMVYVGLSVLGWLPFRAGASAATGGLLAPMMAQFLNARGWFGFFTAGLATGFLPCGLVYSFLAMAVAGGDMGSGMLLMISFGLGTVPAMVLLGCGSTLLSLTVRTRVYRLAACLVIILGVVTIARAFPAREAGHCLLHAPVTTTLSSVTITPSKRRSARVGGLGYSYACRRAGVSGHASLVARSSGLPGLL